MYYIVWLGKDGNFQRLSKNEIVETAKTVKQLTSQGISGYICVINGHEVDINDLLVFAE